MPIRERLGGLVRRVFLTRAVVGVGVSTLVLTASFVGLLAFVSGDTAGVGVRLPYYVLAMGVAFVVSIFLLDGEGRDGLTILLAVSGISVLTLVLVGLAGEGVIYAYRFHEKVLTSQLVLYFAAAGLICTGVVIWGLRHWREFTLPDRDAA